MLEPSESEVRIMSECTDHAISSGPSWDTNRQVNKPAAAHDRHKLLPDIRQHSVFRGSIATAECKTHRPLQTRDVSFNVSYFENVTNAHARDNEIPMEITGWETVRTFSRLRELFTARLLAALAANSAETSYCTCRETPSGGSSLHISAFSIKA